MKYKVNKIAAAVAVSLGTSVVGMNAAQADEILFPYFITSTGALTTILSVINDDPAFGTVARERLHYHYWHKGRPTGSDGRNTDPCQEANYRENTSPHDIVTYDVGGQFGDARGVLFEPQEEQVNVRYRQDFAQFRGPDLKPVIGFAVVDNTDALNRAAARPARLSGEAFVVDFANGAVWGYRGYSASKIWSYDPNAQVVTLLNRFDFSDRVEQNGEVMVQRPAGANPDNYWVPIAIMPFDQVTTRLFVTPIAVNAPFQLQGNLNARIGLRVSVPTTTTFDVMYDRDEQPVSGQIDQNVVCVGRVDATQLVSAAARSRLTYGGWSNVAIGRGTVGGTVQTSQATVLKLEFNPDPTATLDNVAVGGVFNNGYWVRKGYRESLGRPLTLNGWDWLPTFEIPGIDNNAPYPVFNSVTAAALNLPLPPVQDATVGGATILSVNPTNPPDYYEALVTNPALSAVPADVLNAISGGRISISQ